MRHRPLALALVLALATLLAPLALDRHVRVVVAAGGQLLLPRTAGVALLDPASGSELLLHPTQQPVLGVAWAPDGVRVVFAQFGKQPGDRYGSSSLYLLDGGQAALAIPPAGPDQFLTNPTWTGDGRALVYQVHGASAGFSVEQAALDGTGRQTLEANAGSPTVSPDGGLLAFVRFGYSDALVVRPSAGGAVREVVAPDAFVALSAPRFSPDGRRIAFLAIGGPIDPAPTPPIDPLSPLWPGATGVHAHGIPWDPWVVNLDGSGLRPVASISADDPTIAWAPDGSSLAILGGDGLWLVPLDGGGAPALIGHGSYGLLDWRP